MTKQIILLAITVFAAFSSLNAQVKPTSEETFFNLKRSASFTAQTRTRRTVSKTEFFKADGTLYKTLTETVENIPSEDRLSDRGHLLKIEKKGDDETVTEMIWIGSKDYIRTNNGNWSTYISETEGGLGESYGECTQYTREKTSIDNIAAEKFRIFGIANNGYSGLKFHDYSIWYDETGRFMRSEYIKGFIDPKRIESRQITTYEYDLNDLKIEAPIK